MRLSCVFLSCLIGLLTLSPAALAQSSRPAATAPLANEPLVGGALRYAAPDGWEVLGQKTNRLVRYHLGNSGLIEIAVDDLSVAATPALARRMGLGVAKAIRQQAKSRGEKMLLPPRVEQDDRFWLKIHDRMKTKDGHTIDRIQIYRPFGVYIVRVTASSFDSADEQTSKIHQIGEELLDHVHTARGVHPIYYPRTRIKITPPVDWIEHKTDQPNGLVATFTDPRDASAKIIVRARVLPLAARTDTAKRDELLARMIDTERTTAPYSPANPSRSDQAKPDEKFLKRITGSITKSGQTLQVVTRYFVVGDVIASVRSVADETHAANVNKIADELVIAPIRE